ncbi:MAG: hypothetical protein ACJA2S_001185, partial [Cyclobacteriaceae bacterium]
MYRLNSIAKLLMTFICASIIMVGCSAKKEQEASEDAPKKRPNIIFMMSDDHAYQAISAYSDK